MLIVLISVVNSSLYRIISGRNIIDRGHGHGHDLFFSFFFFYQCVFQQ